MCLYTSNKIRRAKEDIVVYKTVCANPWEDTWRGVFERTKQFPFNELLKNMEKHDRITTDYGMKIISKGYFHSYWDRSAAMRLKNLQEYELAYSKLRVKVFKCIIPKGAYYYTDGTEVASRKIIVTGCEET
jgi:hypothetical protein